jgi:hypothetical protein
LRPSRAKICRPISDQTRKFPLIIEAVPFSPLRKFDCRIHDNAVLDHSVRLSLRLSHSPDLCPARTIKTPRISCLFCRTNPISLSQSERKFPCHQPSPQDMHNVRPSNQTHFTAFTNLRPPCPLSSLIPSHGCLHLIDLKEQTHCVLACRRISTYLIRAYGN